MTSTSQQRLAEIETARENAFAEYNLHKRTATEAQMKSLWNNRQRSQAVLFAAGNAILAKNGAEVETAFAAAQAANKEVGHAISGGKALTERIAKVSGAITTGKKLLDSASGIVNVIKRNPAA